MNTREENTWNSPATELVLTEQEVHIWRVQFQTLITFYESILTILSKEEHDRAQRFYFQRDSRVFSILRGVLRIILANYLHVSPASLQFGHTENGKPYLIQRETHPLLRFNVSHAKGLGLIAVALAREVGVDIEHLRFFPDPLAIAKRFFSPREYDQLLTSPQRRTEKLFFRYWTCKEAYLKARGIGLSFGLDRVEINLTPQQPARVVGLDGPAKSAGWWLSELQPGAGYVGACVAEGDSAYLRLWQFWPSLITLA